MWLQLPREAAGGCEFDVIELHRVVAGYIDNYWKNVTKMHLKKFD
jgi:hypothetical protein